MALHTPSSFSYAGQRLPLPLFFVSLKSISSNRHNPNNLDTRYTFDINVSNGQYIRRTLTPQLSNAVST